MNILYVTGEAAPFCKTGGLADVSGSLPVALAARGHHVAVMLPLYDTISKQWRRQMTFHRFIYVNLSWRHEYCGLFSLEYRGVTWYFVDNEHYFARGRLYGEGDDGERFGFFSRAVLDLLPLLDEMPQVIHCNDWQTALVPVYRQDFTGRWDALRGIRTVFTIHNIEYQGKFGANTVSDLFGLDRGWYDGGTLEMDGCVNLMKPPYSTRPRTRYSRPITVSGTSGARPPARRPCSRSWDCRCRAMCLLFPWSAAWWDTRASTSFARAWTISCAPAASWCSRAAGRSGAAGELPLRRAGEGGIQGGFQHRCPAMGRQRCHQ